MRAETVAAIEGMGVMGVLETVAAIGSRGDIGHKGSKESCDESGNRGSIRGIGNDYESGGSARMGAMEPWYDWSNGLQWRSIMIGKMAPTGEEAPTGIL